MLKKQFSFTDIHFDRNWEYKNPSTGCCYRSGIIAGKLLFSDIIGVITTDDVHAARPVLEKVYEQGGFSGLPFVRIADYTEFKGASIAARKQYALLLNQLNKKYNCHPSITFVCNANLFARATLTMFAAFVRQKIIFVDSVSDAFKRLAEKSPTTDTSVEDNNLLQVTPGHIDEISSFLGDLLLTHEERHRVGKLKLSDDNPLASLKDLIEVAKFDYDGLRENDLKLTNLLRRSRNSHQTLLDNIPTQIWFLDNEHTYGAVNRAHAEFTGIEIKKLASSDLYEIFPKDIARNWCEGNREAFRTGKPITMEKWVADNSGEKRFLTFTKTPVFSNQGKVESVVCSAEDNTNHILAEKKLEETLTETKRLNRLMSGREDRVLELKNEVNQLLEKLGNNKKYWSVVE